VTDRHAPWVLLANLVGIAAIVVLIVVLARLSWDSQADPHAPRRSPIASITPTAAAPR
jgi:hypothetical protein